MGHASAMQHTFPTVSSVFPHTDVIPVRKLCASSIGRRKRCVLHKDGVPESSDRGRLWLHLKRAAVAFLVVWCAALRRRIV